MFQTKVVEKIKTHILCSITFSESCAVYEIMWKNAVQPDRPQMAIRGMLFAWWITKAAHTLKIWNTYCFFTATMVTRTLLNVTLCVHCLVCSSYHYPWTLSRLMNSTNRQAAILTCCVWYSRCCRKRCSSLGWSTVVPPYPRVIRSKTYRGCPKPRIVANPIYKSAE
jgi:hypothetical protein